MTRSNVHFLPEKSFHRAKPPIARADDQNVIAFPQEKSAEWINPIDAHVGGRLQMRRRACGLSRQQLALAAGVSVLQLEQLETGVVRINARQFRDFARILDAPPSYFFMD